MSTEIRPFQTDIAPVEPADLHDRLDRTRWSRRLPGDAIRGVPVASPRELAGYRHLAAGIRAFFTKVR